MSNPNNPEPAAETSSMSELPHRWIEISLLELTGIGGLMTDGDWIESKDQDPNGEVRLIQLSDIGDKIFR